MQRLYEIVRKKYTLSDKQIKGCLNELSTSKNLTDSIVFSVISEEIVKRVVVICSNPSLESFKEVYPFFHERVKFSNKFGDLVGFDFTFITFRDLEVTAFERKIPEKELPGDKFTHIIYNVNYLSGIYDVVWFCGCYKAPNINYNLQRLVKHINKDSILLFSVGKNYVKRKKLDSAFPNAVKFIKQLDIHGDTENKDKKDALLLLEKLFNTSTGGVLYNS